MDKRTIEQLLESGERRTKDVWAEHLAENIWHLLTSAYPRTEDILEALPDCLYDDVCNEFIAFYLYLLEERGLIAPDDESTD